MLTNANWGTAALTVITGTLVYVIGRIIERLLLVPIFNLREQIGNIADTMVYWANYYCNPWDPSTGSMPTKYNACSDELRRAATQLKAKAQSVPLYEFFSSFKLIPTQDEIKEAHKGLIGLSNSMSMTSSVTPLRNSDLADKIRGLLGI